MAAGLRNSSDVNEAFEIDTIQWCLSVLGFQINGREVPLCLVARELLLVGGDSAKDQMRALQEGVDVVTGTPGRLDDFISTGKLDLSGVGGVCCHSDLTLKFPLHRLDFLYLTKR